MRIGSRSEVPLVFLIISLLHQRLGQLAGLAPLGSIHLLGSVDYPGHPLLMVMGGSTEEHKHPLYWVFHFVALAWDIEAGGKRIREYSSKG